MPETRTPRAQRDTPVPSAPARPLRVLIVEDHRDAAEVLRIMVERWGHEARVAYDGLRALAMADEFRPDVVLLDIVLPKLHGYAMTREYRLRPYGHETMFIAVTAWGQEADRQLSKAAGIQHHFLKPVDARALEKLLEEAVRH